MNQADMTVLEAQQDMRHAYLGGGSGVLVSGLVWCAAGATAALVAYTTGMLVLFFGGMLIHPLGTAIDKLFKRSGSHTKGNPLASLALESTVILFIGLFLSYSAEQVSTGWFFPIMLAVIGGRYLLFSTLYGNRIYWILGAALAGVGIFGLMFSLASASLAIAGGLIELAVAGSIITGERNRLKS